MQRIVKKRFVLVCRISQLLLRRKTFCKCLSVSRRLVTALSCFHKRWRLGKSVHHTWTGIAHYMKWKTAEQTITSGQSALFAFIGLLLLSRNVLYQFKYAFITVCILVSVPDLLTAFGKPRHNLIMLLQRGEILLRAKYRAGMFCQDRIHCPTK